MDYKMDGLAHIGLVVKNTEQTVAFYTQQLGFQKVAEKTIQTENGKLQVTFLRNGNLTLECLEHEVFPQAHGDGLIVHIAINVKNIEKVIEALDAYGVDWVEGLVYQPDLWENGCKSALFKGPSGEILEVNETL